MKADRAQLVRGQSDLDKIMALQEEVGVSLAAPARVQMNELQKQREEEINRAQQQEEEQLRLLGLHHDDEGLKPLEWNQHVLLGDHI